MPALSATWTVNTTGPITMGLVVPQGVIPSGSGVQVGGFTTQTDVRNTWPADGSARHALVSFNATSTGAKSLSVITNPGGSYTPTWPSASVAIQITAGPGSGATYTATLPSFTSTNTVCNGAVCRKAWVLVTPLNGATPHANLQVFFEVTSYAAGGHKVFVGIQNIRNLSSMDQVTANVTTTVGGSGFAAFTKSNWIIYTGNRHGRVAFVSLTEADVNNDYSTWIAANCIPTIVDADPYTYDTSQPNYALGGGVPGGASTYLIGEADANMGNSENDGRQELNPWVDWEARLWKFNGATYRDIVLRNAQQSGCWTWAIDKDGSDGQTLLKITDGTNGNTVWTDVVAGILGYDGLNWPSHADGGYNAAWRGAFDGANSPAGNSGVDRQHMPEMNFTAYLITGDTFYLDNLRFQASWCAFLPTTSAQYNEQDPYIWPGYFRGRNGSRAEMNEVENGRAWGRPLKFVARATWALPDSYSTDYSYFHTIVQNNLEAVARYIDYLDSRHWGGSWATFVGNNPDQTTDWSYVRENSVSSTASGNPTVLTVIGDNSGVGVSTNDHGMQTGDFVTLTGFSGAVAGLNGHWPTTRLSATTFSVAVNTGSSSSGQGHWETVRGMKCPQWRNSVCAREVSWIGFTGLWTMTASMWAYPDRLAQTDMAMQDNPNFMTHPGLSYGYYPTNCYVQADNLIFYSNFTDYASANSDQQNTAYLLDSQAFYTLNASPTHRGNVQGWSDVMPDTYYTPYATVMLAHAVKRGLSNAQAKYDALTGISVVHNELKRRPGFYQSAVASPQPPPSMFTLIVDPGSYALTGLSASPVRALQSNAAAGSYALSGASATIGKATTIAALVGSYAVSGADITSPQTTSNRQLNAGAGAYALSGFDIGTISPVVALTMVASPGTYALTGVDIGFSSVGFSLTCPSSSASVATPYSSSFGHVGGVSPFTYAIITGALPTGLTLNASTGAVTGTPSVINTFAFTGRITDAHSSTATASCSIMVAAVGTTYALRRDRRFVLPFTNNKRLFVQRLQMFLQVGMANLPPVYLRWSKNGGQTWGSWSVLDAGAVANYTKRVFANVNSSGRNWIGEVAMDAPAPWYLIDAFVDVDEGTN